MPISITVTTLVTGMQRCEISAEGAFAQVALSLSCKSMFNPTHRCKGPVVVSFHYDCRKLEEEVNCRMNENRASYSQLLIESLCTPPQSLCAAVVHVENAITSVLICSLQDISVLAMQMPYLSCCSLGFCLSVCLFVCLFMWMSHCCILYRQSE